MLTVRLGGGGEVRWRCGGDDMRRASGSHRDAELVAELSAGGRGALEELYRHHGELVWSVCLRVCRDRELAEDVCQTVFCELWRSAERFDPDLGTFRGWIVALAHARSVDAVRSEAARRRREDRVAELTPTQVQADGYQVAVRRELRSTVAGLPAAERDAIVATYFGGLSYREAAEVLGAPEGTIKSRIRAGLRRLRVGLEAVEAAP